LLKKFDDFVNGALIDAKGDFRQFLLPNGEWESTTPSRFRRLIGVPSAVQKPNP
jgi:hypothetical protein